MEIFSLEWCKQSIKGAALQESLKGVLRFKEILFPATESKQLKELSLKDFVVDECLKLLFKEFTYSFRSFEATLKTLDVRVGQKSSRYSLFS